jgi:hypothetical protein
MLRWLLVVSTICFISFQALSQTPTATINGRILDPSRAVIAGATVEAINIDTNAKYSTQTDASGLFTIPNLPPGNYRLEASKPGFRTIVKPSLVLHVQDVVALNFDMSVGSISESVTVAGGTPLIDTQSPAVSTLVDRQFVENMPLNGRSFQTLIMLTPGTVVTPTTYASQGQFSVNGQRTDANYFTVDGASANIGISAGNGLPQSAGGSLPGLSAMGGTNSLVSVDAMQEFRVQTSSFAPEFGRAPGGQISIVTRSGTNQFHGTIFDYFRNDLLDANTWFADRDRVPKPKERQNDFGGVLGGPLIKNKTFFFLSYEGARLRQPLTAETTVPDRASRAQSPAAVIPFLDAFPVPNGAVLPGGLAQFNASYSNPSTLDAYSLRIDHNLNSKQSLFARYNFSPSHVTQRDGSTLSDLQIGSFSTHTFTIGYTAMLTQKISNEFRANYSNTRGGTSSRLDNFGGAQPFSDRLVFPPRFSSRNSSFGFVLIGAGTSNSGLAALLTGAFAKNEQRQLNAVDNVSLTNGAHQIKFGADYRWLSPIAGNPVYQQFLVFLGVTGGQGYADSGVPFLAETDGLERVTLLSRNFSLYGQDTWNVSSRMTLTYGLRWDVNPALKGKSSKDQPFTVTNINDPADLGLASRGTELYGTQYGNVAPRIGLAYQLRTKTGWESILRGGFGIFYDYGTGLLGQSTFGFPFTATNDMFFVPLPLTPAEAARPPVSPTLPATAPLYVAIPDLKTPRTYQWNSALEQSLGANQAVSLTYVGAVGRNLLRDDSLSAPNANFQSTVDITRNSATSDYHALELKFQRKMTRGLQALASYTWSHSIDIASNNTVRANTPTRIGAPNVDRGDSDFDVRHSFTAALSYELPFEPRWDLLHAIGGGWSVDNFLLARSALPINLIANESFIGGTEFSSRPDVIQGRPLYLFSSAYPGGKALNSAAFLAPPSGQQGTLGRNAVRAFGAWQDDLTVRRQFRLNERVGLQFRAEFFNILNHPNFGAPTNNLMSPLFGQSTQTLASSLGGGGISGGFNPLYQIGGPRSIQLALKLQF